MLTKKILLICVALVMIVSLDSCRKENSAIVDKSYESESDTMLKESYFAGGCFWGMEKFMASVPGVVDVVSGYANGNSEKFDKPTYEEVCSGLTGYKEAVKVTYDSNNLEYEMLVRAYYIAIDPTVKNRQGNDVGEQYQTGIYYTNDEEKEIALKVSDEIKSKVNAFEVEIEALSNFYDAEEYHQDYLVKNPMGYCHISDEEIKEMLEMFDNDLKNSYIRPSDSDIKKNLTREQYEVTQNSATEPAFNNEFWNKFDKGLYVDVVSGEPLFTSDEKYESSCGWPAFSDTVSKEMQYIEDTSYGMVRTEVRSAIADSHLGHVFDNDPESPSGRRYCINSASLKFIPYDDLDKEGYGYAKEWF